MTDGPKQPTYDPNDRTKVPFFIFLAPFLGRPPPLTRRQWNILGLIAFVTMFDQYDLALFSLALKQIQAELLIPEAELGQLGAIVRLGALPAFFLMVVADRLGRRQVLLYTIILYTLFTGLTAIAPDARWFVVFQFFARTFAVTEVLLAYVVISEELDPEHRGWGIGALAALSACGHGMAMVAFSQVEVMPWGWRSLYLLGLIPLVLLSWMRRSLPETERFEKQHLDAVPFSAAQALRPVWSLIKAYPARLSAISTVVFLLAFAENSAGFFAPKYFQEVHGWTPGQFGAMGFFGGFLGIFGSAFAGRLSDNHGRRLIAIIFLTATPLGIVGYYQAEGLLLAPLWILSVFCGIGGGVVLSTFGNEMFPTSYRSTAAGARMIIGTLGGVLGLYAESALYMITNSHWTSISLLVCFAIFAPLIVYLFFPETRARKLEDISPEIDEP